MNSGSKNPLNRYLVVLDIIKAWLSICVWLRDDPKVVQFSHPSKSGHGSSDLLLEVVVPITSGDRRSEVLIAIVGCREC
jgi:hypothetical protein